MTRAQAPLIALYLLLGASSARAQTIESLSSEPRGVPRLALVVGAENYTHFPAVPNAWNDATEAGRALIGARFDFVRVALDPTGPQLLDYVDELVSLTGDTGPATVVFFFAGHGFQDGDANSWIVPTNARRGVNDRKDDSLPVADALWRLATRRAGLTIVFLDSCRTMLTDSGGRRNAPLPVPQAPDNSTASFLMSLAATDGPAWSTSNRTPGNSPYTFALGTYVKQQELALPAVLDEVQSLVKSLTGGAQKPAVAGDLKHSFHFHRPAQLQAAERTRWDRASTTGRLECVRNFLEMYPDSPFAVDAFLWLNSPAAQQATAAGQPCVP